ncbi:initiation factor 2 subunit family protein [Colletotrichum paranaense]|uniref:Translation initiation factor eIF2B subunit alpha n=3 Tax=Colletotrichum acutatum species complex TaxID=2707335 RepID=A0AAI9YS21_9PEZI|nr:initiation factor 2 subunit family protein [Colletotrichum costaricense]XP_060345666.1 initiation factor 2 subunit family protein [Colletotrichum paranaense]KAI3538920.1 initiation factor 2 subunit family protein [Colletotrichum filicis]KAK0373249.1 initiation factor 2 subunit family protein [Colletotrichum limetticola]KAK1522034.1 initiation factor 2 subunit family protein [Colletotrichum costaricense]KAK1531410.1 initiation factor 2 subunit family protein [Colletotrichum paranaense]
MLRRALPIFRIESFFTYITMATGDLTPAGDSQKSSTDIPIRIKTSDAIDIVSTYHSLLEDPDLTKPVAAIEALIALLNASGTTTVFETLDLVKRASNTLHASVNNPVPLQAGTDLFLQYLVSSLKQQEGANASASAAAAPSPYQSFEAVRTHLLRNGRLFASRAIAARDRIADAGWRFVRDGKVVLTHGASRAVSDLLFRAADQSGDGGVRFKVVYVRDEHRPAESDRVVKELRDKGIPVAEIAEPAVAHVLGLLRQVHMVFVGAEAVTQNGGIISRMGTYQIAKLAKQAGLPFYVAAESHKFVRKVPLDQRDLGFQQHVLDFRTDGASEQPEDAVDYTPPDFISNLVTENGVKLPSYVFEQLLDIYGSLNG